MRLLHHSKWLLVSSVLSSIGQRAEIVIGAALLSSVALGLYAAPARMFGVLELALAALGTVLLPRASRIADRAGVRVYVRRASVIVVMVALIGGMVALLARPLTLVAFGTPYASVAGLVPILSLAAVLVTATAVLKYLVFPLGRPGALATLNLVLLLAKCGGAALLIPVLGLSGAAWALVVSYGFGFLFLAGFLLRHLNVGDRAPRWAAA